MDSTAKPSAYWRMQKTLVLSLMSVYSTKFSEWVHQKHVPVLSTRELRRNPFQAHIVADQPLAPVFFAMHEADVEPNAYTQELLIWYHVTKKALEAAVRGLIDLATVSRAEAATTKSVYSERNLNFRHAPQAVFDSVMLLVCEMGETKLAMGLLKACRETAFEPVTAKVLYHMIDAGISFDDVSLSVLMISFTSDVNSPSLFRQPACTWHSIEILTQRNQNLTEGLAISALHHFSKHGLADACESIYTQHLVPLLTEAYGGVQEWHLAPLVQAHTAAGQVEKALERFGELLKLPSRNLAVVVRPSYRIFYDGLSHLSTVQQVLDRTTALINGGSQSVPIQLINALIRACSQHRLEKERDTLIDSVLSKHAHWPKPDMQTFKVCVENCLIKRSSRPGVTSDVEKAEGIVDIMRRDFTRIKPDRVLYELLIKLYLQGTDAQWEKAFDYLEEMKHHNYLPSAQIYVAILDKLLAISRNTKPEYGDARIDYVLEEMASLSYLGGSRQGYIPSKLPRKFYDELGAGRILGIRDRFYAQR